MPRYLIRVECDGEERFLEWSTVVDAPVTYGMTEEQLRRWHLEEYGRQGSHDLNGRIERCRAKGTSSHMCENLSDAISHNRAGPNETIASLEQIVERYCRRIPEEPTDV